MDSVCRQKAFFPIVLTLGTLTLLAHIFFYYHFYPYIIADDAFISLRYAERLLQGKGLTWNNGEYVEGYSNLLWVLLNAGLGALGMALPKATQFLGVMAAALTPLALFWHAREAKLGLWSFAIGLGVFAVTAPVAVWAVAGLETPLVMLLFALAAAGCYRLLTAPVSSHAVLVGGALALICLLRPEGPLYTGIVASALVAFSMLPIRQRLRLAAIITAIPLVAFMAQLGFRLYYYGHWVANTVLAKVAFTPDRLASGFHYIVNALFFFLPLLLYAAINYRMAYKKGVDRTIVRYGMFLLSVLGALSAAILIGGGDFFPCFRAFMPLFPLIVLMLMHGVELGMKYALGKKEWIFLGYILACHLWQQWTVDTQQASASSPWIEDAKAIGLELKAKYGKTQPTIAVFAAGATPFYSELPALDVFGLTDPYLAEHREKIRRFGNGVIGHELFDGAYVESRRPDILVFELGGHKLCDAYPDDCKVMLPHYRPEALHLPDHDVTIWLRKDSPKVN